MIWGIFGLQFWHFPGFPKFIMKCSNVLLLNLNGGSRGQSEVEWVSLLGKWQPMQVFLLGWSHGQRSLVGYSPWGRKELDTTEQLSACAHTHPPPQDETKTLECRLCLQCTALGLTSLSPSSTFDSSNLLQVKQLWILLPFIYNKAELQISHPQMILQKSLYQYFRGLLWNGFLYHCIFTKVTSHGD